VDLTVLGCSGSYASDELGPCSGYLLREGSTTIWVDAGNGTFVNLQRHVSPGELSAVVLTHEHPDHCVDLYSLHVMLRYGLEQRGLEVFAPSGAEKHLGALVADWGGAFVWRELEDGSDARVGPVDLRFSRTDHPPPTFAVEATGPASRMIYTSDTGPDWSIDAFDHGADFVLSEASYLHDDRQASIHLSARQAGEAARAAGARSLMLTHLWPRVDRERSVAEGSDAFGAEAMLAEPHAQVTF
jgi:ribonuclease BN (tRNA processing enzyme)